MRIHPADSAGWRLKQCSISAAARRWLMSATMSLGSCLLNQKIHSLNKRRRRRRRHSCCDYLHHRIQSITSVEKAVSLHRYFKLTGIGHFNNLKKL
jgi:hypothetical protein